MLMHIFYAHHNKETVTETCGNFLTGSLHKCKYVVSLEVLVLSLESEMNLTRKRLFIMSQTVVGQEQQ